MNVIVTSGATREPIDGVRFISNLSSGRTGAAICGALAARGFCVTQLHGIGSAAATGDVRREAFWITLPSMRACAGCWRMAAATP